MKPGEFYGYEQQDTYSMIENYAMIGVDAQNVLQDMKKVEE